MKKIIFITAILILIGSLAACSSLPFLNSSTTTSRTSSNSAFADPSKLTVEGKTGIGILKLEGTSQAVDAAEAKELIPLFQALKTLSTNNNTAADEISALNKQIKNSLNSDQIAAIEKMTFTSADLRTLMQENGLQNSGSSNSGTASSTRTASGGNFGGPGGPGGIPGVTGGGNTSTTRTQATPNAVQSAQTLRRTAGGLNLTFAEPIIKLLESKISK
jgi:hypothetical protein